MGRNLSLTTRRRNARGINKRVQAAWRGRTFVGLGNRASVKPSVTGENNDLVFIAKTPGTAGNAITVAYSVTNTNASLTTSITGTQNDLVFTAAEPGAAGNSISVTYVVAGNSTPLTVTVNGKDITVNVETNGGGTATSTAAQVKTAIEGNTAAAALVTVANAGGNDGSGTVAAMPKTNLSGAAAAEVPSVGVSTNAITVTTVNSTAAAVAEAINRHATASSLVWAAVASGNDGTGTVRALSATNLTGAS